MKIFIFIFIIALPAFVFLHPPVCYHLTAENLKEFPFPIEQLDQQGDKDFGVKVIQKKNNEWYQCKSYLSTLLFP